MLALLGWMTAVALPRILLNAADDLAEGRTASMDRLLLGLCLLWLIVLGEDLHVSLSTDRLRRFPLDARALLALRLFSIVLSPLAWLAAILTLIGLSPLLSARHPLLGGIAALFLCALTIGVGVGAPHLVRTISGKKKSVVGMAAFSAVAMAFAVVSVPDGANRLTAAFMAVNPATLVTTVAIATAPYAIVVSLTTLLVADIVAWYLVPRVFRRSLDGGTSERAARRQSSLARLPGRLGPLVEKELRAIRTVLDLWIGLILALSAAALSLFTPLSSSVRQAIFAIVCALNMNVTLNCLGLDRPASLTRYLILPIRGMDLLLAKNLAAMVVVAVQLIVLLAIGAWQSGFMQLGAEIAVVVVLIQTHLAWGNLVSMVEPRRIEPRRFAAAGDPVTMWVSVLIGSAPGVAVIVLLQSNSRTSPLTIAAIILVTMGAYYGSLRYAGRSFERRVETISNRLA
jgi:hypothetical protein